MATYWKSSKGLIKLSDMTDAHLGRAWSKLIAQLQINQQLPDDLVRAAKLDEYDDESLTDLIIAFETEWSRRVADQAARAALVQSAATSEFVYLQVPRKQAPFIKPPATTSEEYDEDAANSYEQNLKYGYALY